MYKKKQNEAKIHCFSCLHVECDIQLTTNNEFISFVHDSMINTNEKNTKYIERMLWCMQPAQYTKQNYHKL